MVAITVDNFKDEGSVAIYHLPDGSSVLDLKAEIEPTEGIPIGHQRLVYLSRDLEDDENLELLILTDDKPTIYLCQTRVYLRFVRAAAEPEETGAPYQEIGGMHLDVDLDEPIDTSLPWSTMLKFGTAVNSFSRESIINLLDRSQPLSYYGICNGTTIDIVFGALEGTGSNLPLGTSSSTEKISDITRIPYSCSGSAVLSELESIALREAQVVQVIETKKKKSALRPVQIIECSGRESQVVRAKYNWDGKIMHPSIQGLPLERDALFEVIPIPPSFPGPQWLYGSRLLGTAASTPSNGSWWSRSSNVKGFFPETFVCPSRPENAKEDLETADDMLDAPPLPPFQFPEAGGMTFKMRIYDNGHTYLTITANYELLSSPIDPTHVTITLSCSTYDTRRISSVSLFIETPETEVSKAQVCENKAHREEIHAEKEVTESQSKQTHLDGATIGMGGVTVGLQGGISKEHSIGTTEKGSRVFRRTVEAEVQDNTVHWNLKAPMTKLDKDGLTGKESINLILTKKPVKFKYRCRVTHSRNEVEKTIERVSRENFLQRFV